MTQALNDIASILRGKQKETEQSPLQAALSSGRSVPLVVGQTLGRPQVFKDAPSLIALAARENMVDGHIRSEFDAPGPVAQALIGCFASAWPEASRSDLDLLLRITCSLLCRMIAAGGDAMNEVTARRFVSDVRHELSQHATLVASLDGAILMKAPSDRISLFVARAGPLSSENFPVTSEHSVSFLLRYPGRSEGREDHGRKRNRGGPSRDGRKCRFCSEMVTTSFAEHNKVCKKK